MNNSNNIKDGTKAGRIIGIVLLVLGSLLSTLLMYLLSTAQSLPRLLVSGPAIFGLGLGMFMFPGGHYSFKELNALGSKKGTRLLWIKAPTFHKLAWIISVIIGIVVSFKIMIDQGF